MLRVREIDKTIRGKVDTPALFPAVIRKSEVSIKIHDHNHSISLYTDDIILYLDHFDVSVSSIIKEFDNFSSLSGYKINWSKSALMPINNVKVNFSIPSFIPIKESFIYLGITIYKNIHKIARDNFYNILVKVKNDIQSRDATIPLFQNRSDPKNSEYRPIPIPIRYQCVFFFLPSKLRNVYNSLGH